MDAPRILSTGLQFKKALRECAPEEHGALGPPLQELIFSTRVDGPPEAPVVRILTKIITNRKSITEVSDPKRIGEIITTFCVALEQFTINRADISALCCALRTYRSRIDQC